MPRRKKQRYILTDIGKQKRNWGTQKAKGARQLINKVKPLLLRPSRGDGVTQYEWTDFVIKLLTRKYGKVNMERLFCDLAFGC